MLTFGCIYYVRYWTPTLDCTTGDLHDEEQQHGRRLHIKLLTDF
jgi:hypothetical protein